MPTTPQTTATTSWQTEFSHFFQDLGLIETEKCFNSELVILSQQHLQQLPTVLERLADRLLQLLEQHVQAKEVLTSTTPPDPAVIAENEQKLLYNKKRKRENEEEEEEERMRQLDSEQVQIRATRQEIQQRINSFIQAKQNEVDASNRTEFLNRADPTSSDITCARADAREINRNIQMKFDIVNNEDGPLARSRLQEASSSTTTTAASMATDASHQQLHKERVQNIEQHMNVVFDPNADPPFSVPERLRILEERIMTIEREHPKWAAVHFQQPHRSYPPPPPAVAITRPGAPAYLVSQMTPPPPEVKTTGRGNSSLTRAVLEQLHRQKQAKGINHTATTINTDPSSASSSS